MQLGELPLVVAPLAGGPTTPELVVAAAEAGSFGFLAAGYLTPEAFDSRLGAVRATTQDLGVNLFVPDRSRVDRDAVRAYRERLLPEAEALGVDVPEPRWEDDDHWQAKLDLLVEQPVPWVSFTFGLPGAEVVELLHDAGSEVAVTVTGPGEARAAEEQGADALVVQASAAGGHRGVFDPHAPPADLPLPDLVRAVGAVTSLPLVATGGVGTAADVRAALGAGAVAVQAGTAFLLADEAGTSATHRAALQDATYDETAVTRAFTGRPARGLRNGFMDRHSAAAPVGYPVIHHLTRPMRTRAAEVGDAERLHLWAGTGHRHALAAPVATIIEVLLA
ncbi:MAG TPA: nitronate monooxygenase [Nocardioides sp.]|nr:nitronate monooxygenase [Nocardioides sp.]